MSQPEIDGRTAAAIAAGMLAVALADGDAHPRELALIEAFRAELPDDLDPSGVTIDDDEVRGVLLYSLLSVALADGAISAPERAVIDEIARAHGASSSRIDEVARQVRTDMLGHFEGVVTFREDALAIGAELGFDRAAASAILDGRDTDAA